MYDLNVYMVEVQSKANTFTTKNKMTINKTNEQQTSVTVAQLLLKVKIKNIRSRLSHFKRGFVFYKNW